MNNIQDHILTPTKIVLFGTIATASVCPTITHQSTGYHEIVGYSYISSYPTSITSENYCNDPFVQFIKSVDLTIKNIVKPKTELGRKLLEYRQKALAKGMKTLSADEISAFIREGRGTSAT